MSEAESFEDFNSCVFELAHERETEASYFLHRMVEDYHEPKAFRFNLNAFLNALYSVGDMMRLDLERSGYGSWWTENKQDLYNDEVLSKFRNGRNFAVHRGQLLRGSHLEMGLFRGDRLKLAHTIEVSHDRTSEDLLENLLKPMWIGTMLDEEHSALGEQLGVRRIYRVDELSDKHDVFTACHLAFVRASNFLSRAHEALGLEFEDTPEGSVVDEPFVATINLLTESDVDPDAYVRWGWIEPHDDEA